MMKTHPINLLAVRATRVQYEAMVPDIMVKPEARSLAVPSKTKMQMGHGEIENGPPPRIQVALGCEVVFDEKHFIGDEAPYSLSAQVQGIATWDREEIDDDTVKLWAVQSAPYTLLPYLRALVAQITALSGFPPLTLPLLVLPTPIPAAQEKDAVSPGP